MKHFNLFEFFDANDEELSYYENPEAKTVLLYLMLEEFPLFFEEYFNKKYMEYEFEVIIDNLFEAKLNAAFKKKQKGIFLWISKTGNKILALTLIDNPCNLKIKWETSRYQKVPRISKNTKIITIHNLMDIQQLNIVGKGGGLREVRKTPTDS